MIEEKVIKLLSSENVDDILIGWELIKDRKLYYEDWKQIFDCERRGVTTLRLLMVFHRIAAEGLGECWTDGYIYKKYKKERYENIKMENLSKQKNRKGS